MTIEERPRQDSLRIETALCPSESAGQNQALRTTFLEDGKIVAAAPLQSKSALRALTDEWGLHISGLTGQALVDHARALDAALRSVYTTQDATLTGALHRMHLLLLRQDRFFIAHLGASDVYLIRDRKVHPLALAPNLRKLEESLGFEFEAPGKLEPERVTCGSFSWPDLPAMNMISSGAKPGDYLLFTSPGLFEQRDWPGILGSIARSGAPFEQAAVRLSRVGQARLHSDTDGYLLVHVVGTSEVRMAEASAEGPEDSQTVRAAAAARQEEPSSNIHLRNQLELPSATGSPRAAGTAIGMGATALAVILLGAVFLIPYLRGNTEGPDAKPGRTPRAGVAAPAAAPAAEEAAAATRSKMAAALPTRVPEALQAAEPPPPEVLPDIPVPGAEAQRPVPAEINNAEVLTQDASTEGDPFTKGRELARSGRLEESSAIFRELVQGRSRAFTIQVGVVTRAETVRRYFQNAAGGTRLMLFQAKERSYLSIGLFETQREAWAAVQELPDFFRKQNAVVKPIAQILQEIPEIRAKAKPKPKPAGQN